ncbi:universal stress protein [Pelosinus sp. IPA-1]|uniref:universal stress protein n=1 Tax=Pelosinus sp. IPA-1 TaxID=3029569 RepID=UPI0024362A52|nr:universal stress protein [Pelosinus sp. IPA-1]GMB01008.1 hypothetical protein PIPA1_38070 [Pelosinus sp. IPA-1]
MYEKILVPIDGSEASWHALGHACALGKPFGSKITIVHVVEPYYTLPNEAIYGEDVPLQQVNIAEVEAAGHKILELATKKMNHCLNVCSIDEPCYTLLPGDIPGEPPLAAVAIQEVEASDPKVLELAKQNMSPSAKFETLLKFGSPAKSIISLAKDEHFNLIVVGSRGLSGLGELLLGSVSNKISHAATIPVLIVK